MGAVLAVLLISLFLSAVDCLESCFDGSLEDPANAMDPPPIMSVVCLGAKCCPESCRDEWKNAGFGGGGGGGMGGY